MNETPADCVFCGIIAGTEPATIVREWPDAIAFLPLNPVAPPDGHVLVVPRVHVPDAVMRPDVTAATTARAAELAAANDASNIITSVGRAATQSVFHLHIHVIRREAGDQLMVPWGTTGDPHAPHWCRVADELSGRAGQAEETLAEVRRLCDLTIASSCRVQAIHQAEDTLRILNRRASKQEGNENTPAGVRMSKDITQSSDIIPDSDEEAR